jgi:hypothetical protein
LDLQEVAMSWWGPVLRCVLGGSTLGLAGLTAVSFIGVPIVPVPAPVALSRAALLTSADLPPGFRPIPALATPAGGGCAALLADPAAGWPGAVEEDQGQAATGARLWQAVAKSAAQSLERLRDRLSACPSFLVNQEQAGVRRLPDPMPGGYAFGLTIRGATGSYDGYLAAGRVGAAVSVLRYVAPTSPSTTAASRPEALSVMLRTALARAGSVTGPPRR